MTADLRNRLLVVLAGVLAALGITGVISLTDDSGEVALCIDVDAGEECSEAPTTTAAPTTTTTVPETTTTVHDDGTTTTHPPDDDHGTTTTTAAPTTTVAPPSSTTVPPTTTVPNEEAGVYRNDFATQAQFTDEIEAGAQYRDQFLVSDRSWPGDHADLGNGECGSPDTKRTITRDDLAGQSYWCNVGTGHVMTSQGDTTGYGWVWLRIKQSFTDVTEIRWDVNETHLGNRQFTESMIIPVDAWQTDDNPYTLFDDGIVPSLPCLQDIFAFPCIDFTDDLAFGSKAASFGAVTTSSFNQQMIFTNLDGVEMSQAGLPFTDSARTSIAERRTHILTDNQDGTVTFAIEREDGTFLEHTYFGSFPKGEVYVVFKDHNYTPNKSESGFGRCNADGVGDPFHGPGGVNDCVTFTWHWDNFEVYYEG